MAEQGGPPDTGGGSNLLTRKIAGLPTWGWVGVSAAVGIVMLVWLQNRKKAAAPPATTDTTGNQSVVDSSGLATGQYESLLALLRDIQGQPSERLPGTPDTPGTTLVAPTGVHTVNDRVWQNFLELHWDPVPGAVSYVVRGAGDDRNVPLVTGTMVGGLVHNGSYFLSVAAKDSAGNVGPFSQPTNSHTKN